MKYLFMIYLVFIGNTAFAQSNWSYEGKNGPRFWGDLEADYFLCKNGKKQSPIQLVRPAQKEASSLYFKYTGVQVAPAHIQRESKNVFHIHMKPGNELRVADELYILKSIEFHSPSEHVFQGILYPFEIQMKHQSAKGKTLFLSILVKETSPLEGQDHKLNKNYQHIQNQLMGEIIKEIFENKNHSSSFKINPYLFFPAETSFFLYEGSLSTPPCTEGIQWLVFENAISFKKEILDVLQKKISNNARPIQPLQDRLIRYFQ